MKILFGADLVPTSTNEQDFIDGNVEKLIGSELKKILDGADFRVFNLETPLCEKKDEIKKCGPNLIANPLTINGYEKMGVNLLTLANNHVLDQGKQGFISTLNTIDNSGIDRIGGGMTKEESIKPYFLDCQGKKVCIYNCCEHEFSWFDDYGYGCNGFDPFYTLDEIVELKKRCDYLIVLFHAGKEHYRYPTRYLMKSCRKMADKGADLIICTHSHCVGAQEFYNDCQIIYGTGNFLFDHSASEFWQTSILVSLEITGEKCQVDFIPVEKDGAYVKLSNNKDILKGFYSRSEEIKDMSIVNKKFEQCTKESIDYYMKAIKGEIPTKCYEAMLINYLECEEHRDTILDGLKKIINDK